MLRQTNPCSSTSGNEGPPPSLNEGMNHAREHAGVQMINVPASQQKQVVSCHDALKISSFFGCAPLFFDFNLSTSAEPDRFITSSVFLFSIGACNSSVGTVAS
jgi:hypothetical protein